MIDNEKQEAGAPEEKGFVIGVDFTFPIFLIIIFSYSTFILISDLSSASIFGTPGKIIFSIVVGIVAMIATCQFLCIAFKLNEKSLSKMKKH